MTDQVYFIGYRAEQFTGWDDTGNPSYTSIASTDPYETNSLGYIGLNTSGNVIWKDLDITDTSNPVYIMVELYSYAGGANVTCGNIFLTDGTNILSFQLYGGNNSCCRIEFGTYTTGGTINLTNTLYNAKFSNFVVETAKIYIKLSSTTSSFDTLSVVAIQQGYTTEYTLYSGSITPLSGLKALFSCYLPVSGYTTIGNYFYYCVVANFDLTGSYIDYTRVSAEATYTGWTGNVSTLTTYPLVTNDVSKGLYAYNSGDQVTFTPSKSLTTGDGYTTPKCTFIDTTLMANKDNSGYQAVPIIKSSSSSTTYTMGSVVSPTTTSTNYQWINFQNPSNLSNWTVSDVNTIEFGLKRSA